MAGFRLSVGVLSRKRVASAVAAAAYRSGSRLGEHDYTRKDHVVHAEIVLPEGAPAWMADREALWSAVDASERRRDAQLAREVQLNLPRELERETRVGLALDFARHCCAELGMVADVCVHEPRGSDGRVQPHAHVMLSMRAIDPASPTGFGLKERAWNDRALVAVWREAWAETVNLALEAQGLADRVDHRSLREQLADALDRGDFDAAARLDRDPGFHLGPRVWGMERRGVPSENGELWRSTLTTNAERSAVYARVAELGEAAKGLFLEIRARVEDAFAAFALWAEAWGARARELALAATVAAGLEAGGVPAVSGGDVMAEQAEREPLTIGAREGAVLDVYAASFPELPDEAEVQRAEAAFAEAEFAAAAFAEDAPEPWENNVRDQADTMSEEEAAMFDEYLEREEQTLLQEQAQEPEVQGP